MWNKSKWYLLTVAVTAVLTYVVTSKADEERYTSIVEESQRQVETLKLTIEKYKEELSHVETITVITYDPNTGLKVKEEIKKVEDISNKQSQKLVEEKTKQIEQLKKELTKKLTLNEKDDTVLVGVGVNAELEKSYSVAYVHRWGVVNVGVEGRSDKSLTGFVGLSF